jgi:hypothetical protein
VYRCGRCGTPIDRATLARLGVYKMRVARKDPKELVALISVVTLPVRESQDYELPGQCVPMMRLRRGPKAISSPGNTYFDGRDTDMATNLSFSLTFGMGS